MSEEKVRHPDGRRLGRLASAPEKRKMTLKLKDYLPSLQAPPAASLAPLVSQWPMFKNDQLGDCTCAAAGHMIEVWTAQVDGAPKIVADIDIVAAYNAVNGGQDGGANMLDVLSLWRKTGIAGGTIHAYTEVDPKQPSLVKAGAWLFGGLYLGVELPISGQHQDTWEVTDATLSGDAAKGSWGGHAINVVAYDQYGLTVVTWGALKRMSWNFWKAYVDECYAAIPQDYDRLNGRALTNGFNEDQLTADLAQFGPVA